MTSRNVFFLPFPRLITATKIFPDAHRAIPLRLITSRHISRRYVVRGARWCSSTPGVKSRVRFRTLPRVGHPAAVASSPMVGWPNCETPVQPYRRGSVVQMCFWRTTTTIVFSRKRPFHQRRTFFYIPLRNHIGKNYSSSREIYSSPDLNGSRKAPSALTN